MSFVPVVEKYRYDKNVLTEEIPNFIISPIRGGVARINYIQI